MSTSPVSPCHRPQNHIAQTAAPSLPPSSSDTNGIARRHGVKPSTHILDLPNEVFQLMLSYLDDEADKMVNIDRRGYLSQESFRAPDAPTEEQQAYISNFRLTCRRFSEQGAKRQFLRIQIRFTKPDFERLQNIASVDYLAKNVKKLSYFVPLGFYDTGFYSDNFGKAISHTWERKYFLGERGANEADVVIENRSGTSTKSTQPHRCES
jgi:hypothetical protein